MDRARSHPHVSPDVADGITTPIARSPGHPELDGRARTSGQTWIGWRVQLLPGEVAAAGNPEAQVAAEAAAGEERRGTVAAIRASRARRRRP